MRKQSKLRILVGRFIWWLLPYQLLEFIERETGYVLGRVELNGKPVAFYFQRERPREFSRQTWERSKDDQD